MIDCEWCGSKLCRDDQPAYLQCAARQMKEPMEELGLERDEYKRRLQNEREDAKTALAEAWDTCELYADEMNEARAVVAEGLALWDSEPRPGLRSSWFDFWAKVRKSHGGK